MKKDPQQQSVLQEAWSNYKRDITRLLPAPLVKKLEQRKGKLWLLVLVTVVELVLLVLVGKFVYGWLVG